MESTEAPLILTDEIGVEGRKPDSATTPNPSGNEAEPGSRSGHRFTGGVAVASTFVVLAIWSWHKWPDVLVDFGRELYVPWQLSAGKTLYTELAYINGPLSPYLNALWFRLFGESFSTLVFCNLAILAITTAMIYRLFEEACDRLSATVCCLIFLTVFGFAQLTETGNYNFVTPYSHELTHGIVLTTAMILCLSSYARKRQLSMACVAGLLLGTVFLTKAEVFLAALTAAVAGLTILYVTEVESRQKTLRAAYLTLAAAAVPTALFMIFFRQHMSLGEASTRILGTWTSLFGSNVANNLFYQRSLGLDEPVARLVMAVRAFASTFLLVVAAIVADALNHLRPRFKTLALAVSLTLFVLSCLAKQTADPWLDSIWLPVPWLMLGAALPLVSIFTCGVFAFVLLSRARVVQQHLPFAMWSCFASVLLAKILLTARLYHYGFALAMPATLVLTAGLLHFVPKALRNLYGEGGVFRRFALAMLLADALFFLKISNGYYSAKTMTVGSGDDVLLAAPADARVPVIHLALSRIPSLIPADATMMVLPEGVMLNYLSRRTNPTPFTNFMPPELAIFGETTMLAAMQQAPPDFVVIVPKDTTEYGVGPFGLDPNYGMQVMRWVETHYSSVEEVRGETPGAFTIKIMKREARGLAAN